MYKVITTLTGQNSYGIHVPYNYNTIYGNLISDILGSGTRYGINLAGDYNVAVLNNLYNCGLGIGNSGTGNDIAHNVVV